MSERLLTNIGRLGVAIGFSGVVAKSCLYDGKLTIVTYVPSTTNPEILNPKL